MNIHISGESVRAGKKSTSVAEFCRIISQHAIVGLRKEPIPDGVKWVVGNEKFTTYVIEMPPGTRTITCDMEDDDNHYSEFERGRYSVAFPYVVLVISVQSKRVKHAEVFYRNQPLRHIDDELFLTNLPNTAETGGGFKSYLCLDGLLADFKYYYPQSNNELLGHAINHLWSGEFNRQLGGSFEAFANREERLSSFAMWELESQKDPSFVLGVQWINPGLTVRQAIQNHIKVFSCPIKTSKQLGNLILNAK